MDPAEFTFKDTLRLVQCFNVADNDLIDIKSGLPYPLLSFCIHKLLPADMIGFNDPSNHVVRKGIEETEKETCIFVPTGSTPEGLQVSFMAHDRGIIFSDTDMFVVPKYETLPQVDIYQKGVVKFNENISPGRNVNIAVKDDDDVQHCYPGFVIMTPKDHFIPLEKSLKHVADFDAYTRQFLKDHNYGLSNKGPSLKLEVYHTDEYKNDIIGDSDYVYAFPSHDWPIQAKPWPTRHRPAKWPTEELIRDIIVLGTHYVKKPPPGVDESMKDYYWRISFSFAERELAKSFNDTQRQCAILLKLLKEKEIVPSEVLSSYHMKTIMYWACEEIPEKYWIPSNLGKCFITVDRLYLAVATAKLPHYFIPELNLLANKPKCTLYSILKCLQKIRQSPLSFIGTLTSGYIVRHHIQLKSEGILTPTDDYIKTKIVEDFSKTFRDLLILCSCLLKVVHYRFKKSGQINILNEVLNTIDATTGIFSIATTCNTEPFKTLYHDIKEMAALITFEDEDMWSFVEILNKMKSYETARTGQLLYHHLNEKHARNTIYIQTKTVFPVINMMLK